MQKSVRTPLYTAAIAGLMLLTLVVSSIPTSAAHVRQEPAADVWPSLVLRAEHIDGGSDIKISPPREYLRSGVKTATIHVDYIGYWDPAAKAVFEYAKGIWEEQISSPVTINVNAHWEDLNYISPYVLGMASANDYRSNFSGAPAADTWFPLALASKLAGSDLDESLADIDATFNCAFARWYLGADRTPTSSEYDFASVVLHEIAHGLGFSGSMRAYGAAGVWGYDPDPSDGDPKVYPFAYDLFATNGSGQSLLTGFSNGSSALLEQLQSDNLFFSGIHAAAANGGAPPKLYAPSGWQQGSSYSHLDEKTYGLASGNALMTPSLLNGEVIHSPGPVAMAILEDMGWGAASDLAVSSYTSQSQEGAPASLSQSIARDRTVSASYTCKPLVTNSTINYIPVIYGTFTSQ